ncbi:MAG: hypothetical protein ABMA64_13410 [Myxococcota bacterium]
MRHLLSAGWLALAGCPHTPVLPVDAAAELRSAGSSTAGLVYEGAVARRDTEGPTLFRYERRVEDRVDDQRSSHLTRTADGAPVVLQQAVHTPLYELVSFREVNQQTGLVGQVDVGPDGTATFRTLVDGRSRLRVEPPGEPLLAGPTLFGFVLQRWDSLLAGRSLRFRFLVAERRRSFRFELKRVEGPPGTICFEMSPIDPFLALAVPRAELVFDEDRNLLRYSGAVPPREENGDHLKRLDATVTYERATERFR